MRLNPYAALLPLAMLLGACKPGAEAPKPQAAASPQATSPSAASSPAKVESTDAEFPVLQVAALDGTQYDLAQHRGKWVVVNFWATWCKPCVKEMPDLSALDAMREYIEVIGLAYDDSDPKDIRAFLTTHPVVYPIAIVDPYEQLKSFASPRGLPTTYLIAPDGKLAKKFTGPITASEIEGAITAVGGPRPKAG